MSDANLRLAITFGLLALFIGLEYLSPARPRALSLGRFGKHAGMALISSMLARLALAGGLASVAALAVDMNVGFFNLVSMPSWFAIIVSFLVLDFAIWGQHLVLHRAPLLWRLHRVHHSDTVMDVSTALRFHPFEILASLAFKVTIIMLLGAPPQAVLAFEIILGAGALFTHANIALPPWLERSLRLLFVTPALHMIHHSPNPNETNSNFGFSFNFWDRMFGTYRNVRLVGEIEVGLEDWRSPKDQTLVALLSNPWRGSKL
jgi:sterol desaturase/sphingolipid hydroxylase (fatty acid hydroxylase superfamily)